jgi:hypothetical protein
MGRHDKVGTQQNTSSGMTAPERAADPTPEALEFYRREVLPWMSRYATTPSAYHDANGARLLDAFAQAAVAKERERMRDLYALLEAAQEELRLIKMKDTDAVYDPALRTLIAIALQAREKP